MLRDRFISNIVGRRNYHKCLAYPEKSRLQKLRETFQGKKAQPKPCVPHPRDIAGVKKVVAVASGKGGVGKSTISVNLALALNKLGARVGILDTDLYGPSIPQMLNLSNLRAQLTPEKRFIPLTNYEVQCMSLGFMVKPGAATIWRGPMVMGMIQQLLHDVEWGELDVLVLDLPPGTGDVQLTLTQNVKLSGAVIVSTPQDIALADVVRGIDMFKKISLISCQILGLVENMSFYQCPSCSSKDFVFGKGGVSRLSKEMNVDVLGELPLNSYIRESMDIGQPIVAAKPDSEISLSIVDMASRLLKKMENN